MTDEIGSQPLMDLRVVAEGLQFPEGPVALTDGSVLVVEIKGQTLTRISADGRKSLVAHLGGGPNGLAIGPDGAAYVANNGGSSWPERPDGLTASGGPSADYTNGSIQRVDLGSGEVSKLYTSSDRGALRGPNDLVFDRSGGFWFTDSGKRSPEGVEFGKVFYAAPDGSHISCVRDNMLVPNGIGLSPDETKLYVAETMTSRLWAFDIVSPGELSPPDDPWADGKRDRAHGPLHGFQMLDSLAVEADGRICVGTLVNGGISIFDPNKDHVEHLALPDPLISNICFGGDDMQDAWITASGTGRLYRCRWPRPGRRLCFNA